MAFWRPKASSMENQCAPKSTTLHADAQLVVRYHWLLSGAYAVLLLSCRMLEERAA